MAKSKANNFLKNFSDLWRRVKKMSVKEGYNASLSLGGSVVANLSEVAYEETRAYKEWVPMGSAQPTSVLLGAIKYKVTAKHGYVDNTYLNYLSGGSVLAGTVFPRGGTTPVIGGSCVVVTSKLSNMKEETADPVLDDLTIIMYNVTPCLSVNCFSVSFCFLI